MQALPTYPEVLAGASAHRERHCRTSNVLVFAVSSCVPVVKQPGSEPLQLQEVQVEWGLVKISRSKGISIQWLLT